MKRYYNGRRIMRHNINCAGTILLFRTNANALCTYEYLCNINEMPIIIDRVAVQYNNNNNKII